MDAGMAMAVADAMNPNGNFAGDPKTCDKRQGRPTVDPTERGEPPRGAAANLSLTCATASAARLAIEEARLSPYCSPALTSGRPHRPTRA